MLEKEINALKIFSGIKDSPVADGKTKFSIVIRSYNEKNALKGLISDLLSQDIVDIYFEIIVLDGGSSDGTELEAFVEGCDVYKISASDFRYDTSINFLFQKASCENIICLSGHTRIRDTSFLRKIRELVLLGYDVIIPRQVASSLYCEGSIYEELYLLKAYPPVKLLTQTSFRYSNSAGIVRKELWSKFNFPCLNGQEDEYWYKTVVVNGARSFYGYNICIEHFHDWSPEDVLKRMEGLPSLGLVEAIKKISFSVPIMFLLILTFSRNWSLAKLYGVAHAKGVWKRCNNNGRIL